MTSSARPIVDAWMQHPTGDWLGLDDETARLFLYENANRVFKLGL